MATLEIPDDLDALDLPIGDKIALATMRQRPKISNGCLRKILGLTDSGVRALIRRLRSQRLITVLKIDGEREFRVRVGPQPVVEGGRQKVTKNSGAEIRQKMTTTLANPATGEQRAEAAVSEAVSVLDMIKATLPHITSYRMGDYYASKIDTALEQVKRDVPDPARQETVELLERYRNFLVAAFYIGEHFPKAHMPEAVAKVYKAPSDQLARLYDRIQRQKQLGTCQSAKALLLDIGSPLGSDVQNHDRIDGNRAAGKKILNNFRRFSVGTTDV